MQKLHVQPILKEWMLSFIYIFFPRCCVVCGKTLAKGEQSLCLACNMNLPRTGYHLIKDNPVEQLFWGKIPLDRATSFFFYRKGSNFRKVLHLLKYGGQKEIGESMGRCMAAEFALSGFFDGIDCIVPVPLHPKKLRARGYNQSEWIAKGVSQIIGIPIDVTSVVRLKNTETQTRKSLYERWENVEGIFFVRYPNRLAGKHILIIDDVLTTGATINACALSILGKSKDVHISVLTLAVAE
ncbi:MAG: ComF family protein [Bacteroidaceae bacterium]|nr:ComF family protein [Bacteroidaceae bacterium]